MFPRAGRAGVRSVPSPTIRLRILKDQDIRALLEVLQSSIYHDPFEDTESPPRLFLCVLPGSSIYHDPFEDTESGDPAVVRRGCRSGSIYHDPFEDTESESRADPVRRCRRVPSTTIRLRILKGT